MVLYESATVIIPVLYNTSALTFITLPAIVFTAPSWAYLSCNYITTWTVSSCVSRYVVPLWRPKTKHRGHTHWTSRPLFLLQQTGHGQSSLRPRCCTRAISLRSLCIRCTSHGQTYPCSTGCGGSGTAWPRALWRSGAQPARTKPRSGLRTCSRCRRKAGLASTQPTSVFPTWRSSWRKWTGTATAWVRPWVCRRSRKRRSGGCLRARSTGQTQAPPCPRTKTCRRATSRWTCGATAGSTRRSTRRPDPKDSRATTAPSPPRSRQWAFRRYWWWQSHGSGRSSRWPPPACRGGCSSPGTSAATRPTRSGRPSRSRSWQTHCGPSGRRLCWRTSPTGLSTASRPTTPSTCGEPGGRTWSGRACSSGRVWPHTLQTSRRCSCRSCGRRARTRGGSRWRTRPTPCRTRPCPPGGSAGPHRAPCRRPKSSRCCATSWPFPRAGCPTRRGTRTRQSRSWRLDWAWTCAEEVARPNGLLPREQPCWVRPPGKGRRPFWFRPFRRR